MVRTELREHIFKMLFQIEFNTLEEMPKHLELYFEELTSAKEKDKEYIQKKLEAVIEKLEEIDAILNEKATGWKTSRMNKVDVCRYRSIRFPHWIFSFSETFAYPYPGIHIQ